jgi:L-seryl-tRNA(Ser) seleniumtransferase
VLAATSAGREVVVSRGEAVEIGGGFRIPDVLRQSGATLVEVGTTNRTYARDYEQAVTERTSALMRVHASNFAISGFTARPELGEFVDVARRAEILAIEDVGSGCLLDTEPFGLVREPTLTDSVLAGVDLICASGDKLLGGPQAGIILGTADAVARVARYPLARAVRADKTCLAGLATTLLHYLRGEALEKVPVWWMIARDAAWVQRRVAAWVGAIGSDRVNVVPAEAVIGGGSLPGRTLPSYALVMSPADGRPDELARRLRMGKVPVVPRVVHGTVHIDGRTVLDGQDELVVVAVRAALEGSSQLTAVRESLK